MSLMSLNYVLLSKNSLLSLSDEEEEISTADVNQFQSFIK